MEKLVFGLLKRNGHEVGRAAEEAQCGADVSGDPLTHHGVSDTAVETTQIAPTILSLLGFDPSSLQAVQEEHTAVLGVS